jgi:hypothetical protein
VFAAIIKIQTAIGWMQIFRGLWSNSWLAAHQALILLHPGRTPTVQAKCLKHQDQWLASVASFVMRQAHQLWILRNNERHGVTPAEKASRLRITIERELEEIYATRMPCQLQHHTLFMDDIALHKTKPLLEIRNWISMYSVIIKISCRHHLDAQVINHAGT